MTARIRTHFAENEREHPERDGGPFTLAAYEIQRLVSQDSVAPMARRPALELVAHDMLWYAQIDEIMALPGDQVTPSLKPITSKFLPGGDALSLITAALRGVTVDIDVGQPDKRAFYDLQYQGKNIVIEYLPPFVRRAATDGHVLPGTWGVSRAVAPEECFGTGPDEVFPDAEHTAWRAIELLG